MKTYTIKKGFEDIEYLEIVSEDGIISFAPLDPANSDYQAYLNPDKVEHLTSPLTNEPAEDVVK